MAGQPRLRPRAGPRGSLAVFLCALIALASIRAPIVPVGRVLTAHGPAADALITHPELTGRVITTNASGEYQLPATPKSGWMVALEKHYLTHARPGTVRPDPVPPDHPETPWIDPTPGTSPRACGSCHQQAYLQWRGSPHHLSSQSVLFSALFSPGGQTAWHLGANYPEATASCVSCHAPGGSALETDLPGEGPLSGVHCDFCHKISGLGSGAPGLTHGRDLFNLARPAADGRPVVIGPLPDSTRQNVAYSQLFKQSRFCAPCHEGTVLGTKVYTTFSEWTAWNGPQNCQDCHMPNDGPRRHHHAMGPGLSAPPGGLHVTWSLQPSPAGPKVRLAIGSQQVGHALPTGHIDRHIVGWLEFLDPDGKPILAPLGPGFIPSWATGLPNPAPGFLLARWRQNGPEGPVPFWSPGGECKDSRLLPGQTREMEWQLPPGVASVRLRVEHRKAWPAILRAHQLSLTPTVLFDETKPLFSGASSR